MHLPDPSDGAQESTSRRFAIAHSHRTMHNLPPAIVPLAREHHASATLDASVAGGPYAHFLRAARSRRAQPPARLAHLPAPAVYAPTPPRHPVRRRGLKSTRRGRASQDRSVAASGYRTAVELLSVRGRMWTMCAGAPVRRVRPVRTAVVRRVRAAAQCACAGSCAAGGCALRSRAACPAAWGRYGPYPARFTKQAGWYPCSDAPAGGVASARASAKCD
eukprot:SAG31_NODE_3087_length_4690_cov_30.948377_2_plen_219_part_00